MEAPGGVDVADGPEQPLGCQQLSAASRSHGLKLINTRSLPMERSGPSPLCSVVNCLWVSNPSSWRWRRARRRIAASLVFYGGGCRRRAEPMSESVVVNFRANALWQVHRFSSTLLKAREGWAGVGGGGGQLPPPLGRGRLFKNTARQKRGLKRVAKPIRWRKRSSQGGRSGGG